MDNFDWFFVINRTEFNNTGLVSREITLELSGYGEKEILVCRGVGLGLLMDGVFLRLNTNQRNPFYFGDRGILFTTNNDVYIGIQRAD
jgi:hypothetical protein